MFKLYCLLKKMFYLFTIQQQPSFESSFIFPPLLELYRLLRSKTILVISSFFVF